MIVKVPSESHPGRNYTVDTEKETCNCPAGGIHRHCKHIGQARSIIDAQSAEQDGKVMEPEQVGPVPKNIHEAMLAVMGEIGYVQKTGSIKTGPAKYSFAGEADFIRNLRPSLVKYGIYVHPAKVSHLDSETYTTSGGSVMNLNLVTMVYRFTHAPSQTSIDIEVVGAGADSGDKAIPKANTGALKYALRQAFLIETGDDPDNDASDHQERATLRSRLDAPVAQPPSDAALMGRRMREAGVTLTAISVAMQATATRENFFEVITSYLENHRPPMTLDELLNRAREVQA